MDRVKCEENECVVKREVEVLVVKICEEVEWELARERAEADARAERACAEEDV